MTDRRPIVSYVRVSTARQGRSGLGIEAQRSAIARFAETEGYEIVREFVEVETGKGADALDRRPELSAALAEARKLKCAKARGVVLGGPKLAQARVVAQAAIKTNADKHASNVLPLIREAQKHGATSLRDIADALNARGVSTARGGQWHATSVKNMLERAPA